ncbi:D-chiro-inositol-2-dehydrogenase IolG2 [Salmonella enterica subsp. enterica serovar Infantis]|jgi:myo-inositol 2-dehydrogenase/D-chiro-inositol 1-dehydrogenase|uniref:Thiamine pyrophosphate-requiring enzyme n=113 Tax=Enterobacteriaceae TaxID=543 RepID=Q8ZK50_SALTY|nr:MULTISPECIES: D-chiro-inositol-2-dehydrogenase IolG2 [Enterobacteriaceae]NP_463294.1 putative thiamine pyrophosphate-requiring enzyme [Salmonella enterica subsp. enterica serovar Typhimurium str. LT2]AZT38901.1 D-chiro-inositol-2-dehydrogenase IolG2 [Salmonella enterica subsp. enterica serovar Karamoja]AZT78215.1 D-chiro-inositol-2-dehydrogenase IolG2 [Salmonella enterica subsp. enterica serovar Bareilly]EAA1177922.1 inositol 2-dehydrogenase [Salmonella enterica subsp. enterica serovar Mikaw
MKKLRCGVIGLGRVGKMHVENMYLLPQLDIICAADYFIEEMSDWLYSVNITSGYKNYQELLQRDDIEAVFIFTSTDMHEEIVTAAAQAGKHIFCEKPLSMNEDEQASMAVLRKVKEKGVTLQVAFNRRFDPQFHEVFELVRSGKIGRPQMIKITSRDPDLLPHDLIKRIGGLIFDFTMHDFDMARFMMQDEVSEVYVKGNTLIDPSLKNIDDVDTLAVMLTFRNGGYALIDNSRRAVYGYDQRVEVFGSEGMAYADNVSESTVKVFNSQHCIMKNPLPDFTVRYREAYRTEILHFIDSVLHHTPVVCTGEDALLAQRIAIAAQQSLKSGLPVKITSDIYL